MWEAFKDKQFFLREETWLFMLSIASFLDVVSLIVYKKQFVHSFQAFLSNDVSNYKVIFVSVLAYIIGAIWIPFIISVIAIFFGKAKGSEQYKLTNYKAYALLHQNNILYDMIVNAEAEHKHDVFIAQLYLWNAVLYFILVFLSFTANELPLYFETINSTFFLVIISIVFIFRAGYKSRFYINSNDYNVFKIEDSNMIEEVYPDIIPKNEKTEYDDILIKIRTEN